MYATGAMYAGATYGTSAPSATTAYTGATYGASAPSAATAYANLYANQANMPYSSAVNAGNTTYTYNLTPQYATEAVSQASPYLPQAPQPTQYVGGGGQYIGQASGSTALPYNTGMPPSTPSCSTAPGYTAPPLAASFGGNAGLMNTPNFVFGVGGPSIQQPPDSPNRHSPQREVATYSVGDSVELFSVSQDKWLQAKIIDAKPDGTLLCQYGQHQKEIYKCHYEQYLRPVAAPQVAPSAGRRYYVGEDVDVFSKGEGGWVPAKVTDVADDGTVSVKWGRAQKDIKPCFLEEFLRHSAPAGLERKAREEPPQMVQPTTMMSGPPPSGCPYQVGQPVEVWTSSGGGWIEATVHDVAPDGLVTVKWGVHMKRIPRHDYEGYLRPMASNIVTEHEALRGMANVPTALAQVPSGQLPSRDWMSQGVPGSGVIPPTIPGGYSGTGGVLESSPTMAHPDQSSFNYQAPPTAFGGMTSSMRSMPSPSQADAFATAPTNLGTTGGPMASLRYHDVPPTIPGGYA